ncbi:MAG: endolytic transglycosylase MltG, partial [Croceibacterium sp.]
MWRKFKLIAAATFILLGVAGIVVLRGWIGPAHVTKDTAFIVPSGASLTSVAGKLEDEGLISSSGTFLTWAKLLGGGDPIKAGEFLLPAGSSPSAILDTLQHGAVIRRFVAIPEGLPAIMAWDRLNAEPLLTGTVPVPAEGSLLPESYDFERGETRAAVVGRMQQAMTRALAELWS